MPEYLSPGIYVEEVDRGPKPIEGVGTAMPVFIGFSEKAQSVQKRDGELVVNDLTGRAELVTNWTQYNEKFGGFVSGAVMPNAVYGFFQNGGSRCYVVSAKSIPPAKAGLLNSAGKPQLTVKAKTAGFDGAKMRVNISLPEGAATAPAEKKGKAAKGKESDAPAAAAPTGGDGGNAFNIVVEREKVNGGWHVMETIRNASLTQLETDSGAKVATVAYQGESPQFIELVVGDTSAEVTALAPREQTQPLSIETKYLVTPTVSDFQGEVMERTGIEGLEAIDDITMVVVPDLMTTMPGEKLDLQMVKAVQTGIIAHCEKTADRLAILDTPPDLNPQQVKNWRMNVTGFDSSYAAMYYPWIEVNDPVTNRPMVVPPSGHVAGVWSRSDNTRGVHKAPANEVLQGVTGLAYNCTKGEQDVLNPNGVNCIRAFPGMGIRVWGARTLSSNPSWRYINVRRLFNYVEKSIERGTQWIVFEPNEPKLWGRIKRDVGAFMKTVWSSGALFGNSPDQAFYVRCDEELNPPESRDLGRLIIEIGMAPVKPAEFVIFRISQWSPEMDA